MKNNKISNETLLQALVDFYEKNQRTPTRCDFANNTTYQRRFGTWNKAILQANLPIAHITPATRELHPCANCDTLTKNPRFCSKSCSAAITNKETPRRPKQIRYCKVCQKPFTEGTRTTCTDCDKSRDFRLYSTLGDIHAHSNHASRYSCVRGRARTQYKERLVSGCQHCGYTTHVDVCHRQSISTFPDDTLIDYINRPENILFLCRNCHWEFDHGILKL